MSLAVEGKAVPDLRLRVPEDSGTLAVEATVTLRTTRLGGFVRRAGKPVGGTMVVLIPVGPATTVNFFCRDQSDLDGSFVLNGVVPCNYLLLAIEDGWMLPWTDTTAMAAIPGRRCPITVPAAAGSVATVKEDVLPQPR